MQRCDARPRPARRAFTLIEAIASMLVVSILVPPTLIAISDAQIRRAGVTLASRARWLAGAKLEDVIADRHSTTRGYSYVMTASYPAEPSITGFPGYSRSVTVVETAADLVTPGTGNKVITVTVTWTDPRQGVADLSLSSAVTNY